MARWNKRWTSAHLTESRNFFEQALVFEPDNVEALVGIAMVDWGMAGFLLADDPYVRFPAAEAILIKAPSLDPQHARAHLCLGGVQLCTSCAGEELLSVIRVDLEPKFGRGPRLASVWPSYCWPCYRNRGSYTGSVTRVPARSSRASMDVLCWLGQIASRSDAEHEWLRRS